MILQLGQLFDIEGMSIDIDENITAEELSAMGGYEDFSSDMHIKGRAQNRAGVTALTIDVSVSLRQLCDRCCKEFERRYDQRFVHTLTDGSDGFDNEDNIICLSNTLDLGELALMDLRLALPTKILCREDCKGLCAVCGKDLNEGACGCGQ